ncbi:MgtC/SapB family protein [Paracoccus sp. MC1854]|uniref:MgtC/SapB family protein n=1 Tax=Paracoccus sp. MC1854 TaxID=2760306 RepID=UPI001602952E|nr:MgtC/SapB family protein [Paracoccus sp. MC1854]MBB1490928.1 MgtC/SapB family protein [Paracoccus sp. MC1854]
MDAVLADLARAFDPLGSMPLHIAALRLIAAIVLGGVIGWDREVNARSAGLRTHMLISLAAATFVIVGIELTSLEAAPGTTSQIDPLRLIEGVTSGVAFLAAGSIIINGTNVRGITTGASMWLCGAIGLCCGLGDITLAILTTVLAMTVLQLIQLLLSPVAKRAKGERPDADAEGPKDRGG